MYFILYVSLTTAILGCCRNYVKYKTLSPLNFIRTPLICLTFYWIISYYLSYDDITSVFIACTFERWFFLLGKGLISLINNDYVKKKEKYKIKYNFVYEEEKTNK